MIRNRKVVVYGIRFEREYAYNRADMAWFVNLTDVAFFLEAGPFYNKHKLLTLIYRTKEARDAAGDIAKMRFSGYSYQEIKMKQVIYEKLASIA